MNAFHEVSCYGNVLDLLVTTNIEETFIHDFPEILDNALIS